MCNLSNWTDGSVGRNGFKYRSNEGDNEIIFYYVNETSVEDFKNYFLKNARIYCLLKNPETIDCTSEYSLSELEEFSKLFNDSDTVYKINNTHGLD
jgi:hypothetical protein